MSPALAPPRGKLCSPGDPTGTRGCSTRRDRTVTVTGPPGRGQQVCVTPGAPLRCAGREVKPPGSSRTGPSSRVISGAAFAWQRVGTWQRNPRGIEDTGSGWQLSHAGDRKVPADDCFYKNLLPTRTAPAPAAAPPARCPRGCGRGGTGDSAGAPWPEDAPGGR